MSHGIESFGLRYITSGMGSPELAINQNLLVNYVLHKGIEDRDLTAPPGSPADGAAYIPAAPATGVWAAHEDHIAYWFDEVGVWKFLIPEEGISIYVNDENLRIQYLGGSSGWAEIAGTGTVTSVDTAGAVHGLTLTGGPITGAGTITLSGTWTPSGSISWNNQLITNLLNPVSAQDAATKQYVDDEIAGVSGATYTAGIGLELDSSGAFSIDSTVATLTGSQTLTNKTLTAPEISSVELGHASDTTITRVSPGVAAIEGVNIVTTATNKPTECIALACSDETTDLTAGTAKLTFRMPYAFTLTAVRASVTTAPTGATLTVDINESGTTILSTKLTIDVSEKTSTTAAAAAVISDTSLADDAEITVDIDQIGSTIAGAGLKIYLIGNRT